MNNITYFLFFCPSVALLQLFLCHIDENCVMAHEVRSSCGKLFTNHQGLVIQLVSKLISPTCTVGFPPDGGVFTHYEIFGSIEDVFDCHYYSDIHQVDAMGRSNSTSDNVKEYWFIEEGQSLGV